MKGNLLRKKTQSEVDIDNQQSQMTLAGIIEKDMKSSVKQSSPAGHSYQTIEDGIKESLSELYKQLQSNLQPVSMNKPLKQTLLPTNPHQIAIPSKGHCIVSGDLRKLKEDKSLLKKECQTRMHTRAMLNKKVAKLTEVHTSSPVKHTCAVSKESNTQHEFWPTKYLNSSKHDQIRVWMIHAMNGGNMQNQRPEIKSFSKVNNHTTTHVFHRKRKLQSNDCGDTVRANKLIKLGDNLHTAPVRFI